MSFSIILYTVIIFLPLFLGVCIDYLYNDLQIGETAYIVLNSVLIVLFFTALIFAWYPLEETGDKTIFGQHPFYIGQKILEVLVLPTALLFASYIIEKTK